jgi:tocopherol O-methyltransferase
MRAARPLPDADEALLSHWLRGWMIPDLDTAQQHAQHARAAGLSEIAVRDVTTNVRPSLRRLYGLSLAGVPISRVLHKLGLRGAVLHGNALGSMYQYLALRRGSWAYSILCARKSPAESGGTSSQHRPSTRGVAA